MNPVFTMRVRDAATVLKCSRQYIHQLIASGKLDVHREIETHGTVCYLRPEQVQTLVDNRKAKTPKNGG